MCRGRREVLERANSVFSDEKRGKEEGGGEGGREERKGEGKS